MPVMIAVLMGDHFASIHPHRVPLGGSPARRVIFPSLHGARPPPPPRAPRGLAGTSPAGAAGGAPAVAPRARNPVLRANSLDSIDVTPRLPRPLPSVPAATDRGSPRETAPPHGRGPAGRGPGPPCHAPPRRPRPPPASRPSPFFGDAAHRTYYPAASAPTPVGAAASPSPSRARPRASILRRGAPAPSSPTTAETCSSSGSSEAAGVSPLPQAAPAAVPASLPPPVPGLAAPASQKSPRGESEGGVEHPSDEAKASPGKQGTVRRDGSAVVVEKGKADHAASQDSSPDTSSRESGGMRHASHGRPLKKKAISFDPHITVYEFVVSGYERKGGGKWYGEDQLARFKEDAARRIRLRSGKLVPTGTGRALTLGPDRVPASRAAEPPGKPNGAVSFNHPALGCDDELDESCRSPRKGAVRRAPCHSVSASAAHIRNILVVDPHHTCLSLFTKSLKHMVPHALVATARSSEEAMARIYAARRAFPVSDGGCTHGFDIVIVEERLRGAPSVPPAAGAPHPTRTRDVSPTQAPGDDAVQHRWDLTSGAALIRHIESELAGSKPGPARPTRHSLLVGVSARLSSDQQKLYKSGADCVWGKPPPEMNTTLRNELLELLMKKRNT